MIGYSNVAVLNWIREFGKVAEEYHNEAKKHIELKECELDEMRHFLKKNETNCEYGLFVKDMKQKLWILN